MAQSLSWALNLERGTISFGRLLPLTGNTYDLAITGGAAGESYTFYVMDESGEVCLAKSETSDGSTTIAFNSAALRNQFVKEWHETRMFHCVCSNGAATIAEADLFITWNPVWTDVESGSAYSMRGPRGIGIASIEYASTDEDGNITYQFRLTDGSVAKFLAPRGPRGPATDFGYVKDESGDGKWHKIVVRTNRFGEKTIDIEQDGIDTRPDSSDIVTVGGSHTLSGHTHGGQMQLFGHRPTEWKGHPDKGLYEEQGRFLYVNAGLGGLVSFRLNMPNEITVITLKSRRSAKE